METKEMVPKLRFSQFNSFFQKKRIAEIADVNPKSKDLPSQFIYIDLESVKEGKLLIKKYITLKEAPSRAQRKLITGDILYQSVRPYQKNNFHFKFTGDFVASTGYIQLREKFKTGYLYQIIHNDRFVGKVLSLCTGSNYPTIGPFDLSNIEISIPSVEEQQKIASFLSSVDQKISQLEKKKTLLETYKRGIMHKIFSQQLRFKDENGQEFPDWKEDVLGNIFDHKKGTGLSGKELDKDGEFPCILYGALYTKYDEVIKNVIEFSNIPGKVKSISGDLLVPASTTTSGIDLANFTALNQDGVSLGGDITIMRNKDKGDNSFWAYYLTHFHKKGIAKYAQGTTIVHLYFSHFKHLVVKYPSFKEQQKIASFLSSIDNKIEITSTQLEKTREFKKGLLQQMFV